MTLDQLRLEYKLDLIISALKHQGLMLQDLPPMVGMQNDICPVCNSPTKVTTDGDEYQRKCACQPPVRAVGMSKFLEDPHGRSNRTEPAVPRQVESGDGGG